MVGRGGTGYNSSGHWKTPGWSKKESAGKFLYVGFDGSWFAYGIAPESLCLVGLYN